MEENKAIYLSQNLYKVAAVSRNLMNSGQNAQSEEKRGKDTKAVNFQDMLTQSIHKLEN